ncbi:hypothetical protein SCG7086_AN_00240 [Chlamydiales bacterium SCGC AG-110-P3]|nr:hypothetical protein SCG7086_AN_00240 [Chlamydiales bacterium SCGC AG-110-P3]
MGSLSHLIKYHEEAMEELVHCIKSFGGNFELQTKGL